MSALEEGPVRFRNVLGACALALASVSCSLDVDSVGANAINVFIEVSDAQLTVGQETVTLTVTARNVGDRDITLTGPANCLLFIEIRDPRGLLVWDSNASCQGGTVTETLAVGADRIQTFTWDGTNTAGAPLAPGPYNIRAVARVTSGAYVSPAATIALD